jgi:photosystem II stability/assembly factor-like uncharacterized protein
VTSHGDGQSGWAVGNDGTILDTRDGGNTWQAEWSGTTADLHSVMFTDDGRRGWTVGDSGTILGTSNGGNTWSALTYARYPAPWFVAAAFLVLGGAISAGWRLGRRMLS